jgi:hypothetical protein
MSPYAYSPDRLGGLIADRKRYEDHQRLAEAVEAQHAGVIGGGPMGAPRRHDWHPLSSGWPGYQQFEIAFCAKYGEMNFSNLLRARAIICQRRSCDIPTADAMSLEEAALQIQ